jgi:hypothetical protein
MKCWILECFTEGEDGNAAWGHLATLVDIAKAYKLDNGEYPGLVTHRGHGILKLRRDELAEKMKRAGCLDSRSSPRQGG